MQVFPTLATGELSPNWPEAEPGSRFRSRETRYKAFRLRLVGLLLGAAAFGGVAPLAAQDRPTEAGSWGGVTEYRAATEQLGVPLYSPTASQPDPTELPGENGSLESTVFVSDAPAPVSSGAAVNGGQRGEQTADPGESAPLAESAETSQTAAEVRGAQVAEPAQSAGEEPADAMEPIPDPIDAEPVEVQAASFQGVTPGVSTMLEVQQAWGPPREVANRNAQLVQLYSVDPFEQVEVTFFQDRVAAIVIRLDKPFPADLVAEHLKLSAIRPVMVANELGMILGQAFPERGVMFAFERAGTPDKPSTKVVQIVLEAVSGEAFLLRAQTTADSFPDLSLRDVRQAIELEPENPRALWLQAKLLLEWGDPQQALRSCDEAIRLAPDQADYRLTRARINEKLKRRDEALDDIRQALTTGEDRAHVKAQAFCLAGDLFASGEQPDYRRAVAMYVQAIRAADTVASSPHPAIRVPAKEVLIDAHLGAAQAIAWGQWEEKNVSLPRWLERAEAVLKDVEATEHCNPTHRLRAVSRALSSCVGVRGQVDPRAWVARLPKLGEELLSAKMSAMCRRHLEHQLGLALYDAVQVYQMRGDHELALEYGLQAATHLAPENEIPNDPQEAYLIGRLYFRVGAIYALGRKDHKNAVVWFEKATPLLEKAAGQAGSEEFGRLGETYVSMGVSYWEVEKRQRAVELTQTGLKLLERAVRDGRAARSVLRVPYTNLATMERELGNGEKAEQYLQQAQRVTSRTLQ